jgi:hypothetical protein
VERLVDSGCLAPPGSRSKVSPATNVEKLADYSVYGEAAVAYDTLAAGPYVPANPNGYYQLPMNLYYENTTNRALSFFWGN